MRILFRCRRIGIPKEGGAAVVFNRSDNRERKQLNESQSKILYVVADLFVLATKTVGICCSCETR